MAYIIGVLTDKEVLELERRGWELEKAPRELVPNPNVKMYMVWVDNSMFSVMDGPDWDKGPQQPKCEYCGETQSDDESLRKHYDWHNEQLNK